VVSRWFSSTKYGKKLITLSNSEFERSLYLIAAMHFQDCLADLDSTSEEYFWGGLKKEENEQGEKKKRLRSLMEAGGWRLEAGRLEAGGERREG
jgi:hypothetical protein